MDNNRPMTAGHIRISVTPEREKNNSIFNYIFRIFFFSNKPILEVSSTRVIHYNGTVKGQLQANNVR